MKVGKTTLWGAAAVLSLAIAAAPVFVWPDNRLPLAVFVVWTAVLAAIVPIVERSRHRRHSERLLEHARRSSIKTLSHHRHDWMNELQILYGYLRLNKIDRAIEVVDRIRTRMDGDSKISQLGIAELAVFFLSFRTLCDSLRLEVEVDDGVRLNGLPERDAAALTQSAIAIVNLFRYRTGGQSGGENTLHLRLGIEASELRMELRFEGELAAADSVAAELSRSLAGIGQWTAIDEPGNQPLHRRTIVVRDALPALTE